MNKLAQPRYPLNIIPTIIIHSSIITQPPSSLVQRFVRHVFSSRPTHRRSFINIISDFTIFERSQGGSGARRAILLPLLGDWNAAEGLARALGLAFRGSLFTLIIFCLISRRQRSWHCAGWQWRIESRRVNPWVIGSLSLGIRGSLGEERREKGSLGMRWWYSSRCAVGVNTFDVMWLV